MNKTTKECITCQHYDKTDLEHPCNVCILNDSLDCGFEKWEPYKLEKHQSLLKKYFHLWWKMSKLIYEIFILNRKCARYPDLKKYRKNPDVQKMVRGWRSELKGLRKGFKSCL